VHEIHSITAILLTTHQILLNHQLQTEPSALMQIHKPTAAAAAAASQYCRDWQAANIIYH